MATENTGGTNPGRNQNNMGLPAELNPIITCYSYVHGEVAEQANIYHKADCILSGSFAKRLLCQIIKVAETDRDKKNIGYGSGLAILAINPLAGTQTVSFNTLSSYPDNLHVAGHYTVGKVPGPITDATEHYRPLVI